MKWVILIVVLVLIGLMVWLLLRRPSGAVDGLGDDRGRRLDEASGTQVPPARDTDGQADERYAVPAAPYDQSAAPAAAAYEPDDTADGGDEAERDRYDGYGRDSFTPSEQYAEPVSTEQQAFDADVLSEAPAAGGATAYDVSQDERGEDPAWEVSHDEHRRDAEDDWTQTDAAPHQQQPGAGAYETGDYGYDEAHAGATEGAGFGPGPYGPGSATPLEDGSGPAGWQLKGNTGSMLFHTPDSPSYDNVLAEVWFEDEDAARAAGFAHWDRKRR